MAMNTLAGQKTGAGYPGLDIFRMVAAALVVAVHTSPLLSVNETADFIFTRVAARLAVPFFFMVSGFFLAKSGAGGLGRFALKNAKLYALCILLYLPLNWYMGDFAAGPLPERLGQTARALLYTGTVYHLWYFPAVILGAGIAWVLRRYLGARGALVVCGLLYLAGAGGDSWFGIVGGLPGLGAFYRFWLGAFTYTRGGVFFAPLFLLLGMLPAGSAAPRRPAWVYGAGFVASFGLMLAEALWLHGQGGMQHDSMYVTLPLCSVFLFCLLRGFRGGAKPRLRKLSALVFVLHPWCIVAVRGAARVLRAEKWMVQTSPVFYLCVCGATLAVSLLVLWVPKPPWLPGGKKSNTARGQAWRARAQLDEEALRHNLTQLQGLLPAHTQMMAVVKDEAYGHGGVWAAKNLQKWGVRAFAVATLQEGVRLRRHGVRGVILVLGYTPPAQAAKLWFYRLTQTAVDAAHAKALAESGFALQVHLKVDTGMHRLGVPAADVDQVCGVYALPRLRVTGIYTHLARAGSINQEDERFTTRQIAAYYTLLQQLAQRGVNPGKTHLQSSYGLLNYPGLPCHYARCGLALYGAAETPGQPCRAGVALRPVLTLQAQVAAVHTLPKGAWVGYGRHYQCAKTTRVATVTIGYGDGVPRSLQGAEVLVRGQRAPVIGKVCMDQLCIEVNDIPGVQAGDVVTLIGRQASEQLSAEALAAAAGGIANEVLAGIGSRVARVQRKTPAPRGARWRGQARFGLKAEGF